MLRGALRTAVAVFLSAGVLSLVPSSADAAAGAAVQRLGACLSAGGQGDVLVVLDTSASLRETDPNDDRVAAATYFVEQLAKASSASGAKVDVAVAGFASGFDVAKGWTAIGADGSSVTSAIAKFRDRDNGFETDYWTATDGARSYLAAKAGGATDHCQALVWFSDGMYDLDKRDTKAEQSRYGLKKPYGPDVELTSAGAERRLEKAGAKDLCRPGGVADQIRVQGITTLAVGLRAGGDADFALMKDIATGADSCGQEADRAPGEFILADRIGDLYLAFDSISDPGNAPIQQDAPLCQGSVCPKGTHRFVLDSGISSVHIVGTAGVDGFTTYLVGPDTSQRIVLGPEDNTATQDTSGWSATAGRLSGDTVEMDLTRKTDAGWVGAWQLVFVDEESRGQGTGRSNIHLYGDLKPALLSVDGRALAPDAASVEVTAGGKADLGLGLVHSRDNSPVGKLDGRSSLDAVLELADGTSIDVARGVSAAELADPVSLDLTKARPGPATLQLSLSLTTADTTVDGQSVPGTALEVQSTGVQVVVKAPASYPTVADRVSFGSTEEPGTINVDLPVSGKGCVWLSETEPLTVPDGVSDLDVTSSGSSQESCVRGDLPLTLEVGQQGAGLASGELTVMTQPTDGGDPIATTVRYELEMKRVRNDKVFWPLLAGITLAGVLIPVGLLYLIKWRTARIPATALAVGSVSGAVGPDSSFLGQASLAEQQMRVVVIDGTDRRSVSLGRARVETRTGLGLTEPSYAVVVGPPSTTSGSPSTIRRKPLGRLPLAVRDSWVAVLDEADPHRGAVEVVFITSTAGGKLAELMADARNRAPGAVAKLRERLGDAPPAAPRGPGDGFSVDPFAAQAGSAPGGSGGFGSGGLGSGDGGFGGGFGAGGLGPGGGTPPAPGSGGFGAPPPPRPGGNTPPGGLDEW